ncbi:hypothetical protein VB005_09650 [Metarhizium brunneum]
MVSPVFCLPKLGRPFTSFGHKANYASSKNTQCRHSETFRLIVVLGPNLVASLMYFALFGYGIHNMLSHRHEAGLIYSPARSAVTYEAKVVDDSVPAAFAGPPSLETDAAWQRLLKYNNLVVQKEDLKQVDRSSVSLRDGSGYLASLSVYHQLHCLVSIFNSLFQIKGHY